MNRFCVCTKLIFFTLGRSSLLSENVPRTPRHHGCENRKTPLTLKLQSRRVNVVMIGTEKNKGWRWRCFCVNSSPSPCLLFQTAKTSRMFLKKVDRFLGVLFFIFLGYLGSSCECEVVLCLSLWWGCCKVQLVAATRSCIFVLLLLGQHSFQKIRLVCFHSLWRLTKG